LFFIIRALLLVGWRSQMDCRRSNFLYH
jgi:hypothetical protein